MTTQETQHTEHETEITHLRREHAAMYEWLRKHVDDDLIDTAQLYVNRVPKMQLKIIASSEAVVDISNVLFAIGSRPAIASQPPSEPAPVAQGTVQRYGVAEIGNGIFTIADEDGSYLDIEYVLESAAQTECDKLNALHNRLNAALPAPVVVAVDCETSRHKPYFDQLRSLAKSTGQFAYGWNSACIETGQDVFMDAYYYADDKIAVWAAQENPYALKVEWLENRNPVLGIYPDGKIIRCHGEFSSVRQHLDSLNAALPAPVAQGTGERYIKRRHETSKFRYCVWDTETETALQIPGELFLWTTLPRVKRELARLNGVTN